MEAFQPFFIGRQETRSGRSCPLCVGRTERIVMIWSAEIVLALGQEVGFDRLALVLTPRILHHHVGAAIAGGISPKV